MHTQDEVCTECHVWHGDHREGCSQGSTEVNRE